MLHEIHPQTLSFRRDLAAFLTSATYSQTKLLRFPDISRRSRGLHLRWRHLDRAGERRHGNSPYSTSGH